MKKAKATIIAHSSCENAPPLLTYQLRYWRPIHSELMTHRQFSRNAGSSRARPAKGIIDDIRLNGPWGPVSWGKNQPGMQAFEELTGQALIAAQNIWFDSAMRACDEAELLMKLGAHKQVVNRILEPYTYIDVVVSSTAYANWFGLRKHEAADPTIKQLADVMYDAYVESVPTKLNHDEWHLPYIQKEDWESTALSCKSKHEQIALLRKISAARCARTSYKAFDGTVATIDADLDLYNKLVVSQPVHASPTEHQATPDVWEQKRDGWGWANQELHGNFNGWIQHRKLIPNEVITRYP